MLQGSFGLLIALFLTTLLIYQASRATPRSRLRQTYSLAAWGFGLIIVLNFLFMIGVMGGVIANTLGFASVGLLLGSAISFVLALVNGEFRAKVRQAQEYTANERERLAQRRFERDRAAVTQPDHPISDKDKH